MAEYEGFIHIGDGLWYEEATGLPWSTRRCLGGGRWGTDGPLKRLTGKSNGYYNVYYQSKTWRWHRLVYNFFNNGYLPDEDIDHADIDKNNNRIDNLRPATKSQSVINQKKRKNCSSKYKGVSWHKKSNNWKAQIRIEGKKKHLGYFSSEEEAAKAYDKAAREHHKEFANPNFPENQTSKL